MRPKLVIVGASGHAKVVADIVRLAGTYEITGFLDDSVERHGSVFCGAPILGGCRILSCLREEGVAHLIVAIGDCEARLRLADLGRRLDFGLANAVHPRAIVAADVPLGTGTVVAAGAVVNPGAVLGDNVIINTCASVDHDCRIEDGVHISPGARLAGGVEIGRMTWIGAGAVLRERVRVGRNSVVGAGSVILKDVPEGVVVYGVPGRIARPIARSAADTVADARPLASPLASQSIG